MEVVVFIVKWHVLFNLIPTCFEPTHRAVVNHMREGGGLLLSLYLALFTWPEVTA